MHRELGHFQASKRAQAIEANNLNEAKARQGTIEIAWRHMVSIREYISKDIENL